MVSIPNLPTDNLYKFLALAGLTILVLSVVLPAIRSKAIYDQLDQTQLDLAAVEGESQNIDADLKRMDLSASEREQLWQRRREHAIHLATNGARIAAVQRLSRTLNRFQWEELLGGLLG
jgi:hypothetical protein